MSGKVIIPVLRIFDEPKARDFYVEFLGFEIDWEHRFAEDFPLYMQVSKGAWHIHLTGHHGDCCPGSAVLLQMEDVEQYQTELLAKRYRYSRPGCEQTNGVRLR